MKGRLRPMVGFKTFCNVRRVIIGIELAQKIHKRQFAIPISWRSNPGSRQRETISSGMSRTRGSPSRRSPCVLHRSSHPPSVEY